MVIYLSRKYPPFRAYCYVRKIYLILPLCVILIATSACSSENGCDLPRQEPLSSSSSLHLLGNTEVTWETNPPTSGPHYPIPPKGGNYDYALSNLDQVSFLESGGVIVQYLPDINGNNHPKLASFASNYVIISPNETLESLLVATAWTWKLSCKEYDFESLAKFIAERQGEFSPTHTD
ncbi:MAG: hypothetical protein CL432_09725 [Acidimicrobiaceae bacterium]|nr:hypothetical protein [Acidimicrobiaceae bacterium]